MRILIAVPVPPYEIAGPATVARELRKAFEQGGDTVQFITLSRFERALPIGLRQLALFLRSLPMVYASDAVLLLDPASTGPSLALAANILKRKSALRVGGDFLWESYVERTGESIILSEFYAYPRSLIFRERVIHAITNFTLKLVDTVAFTTSWQRDLWNGAYELPTGKTTVVSPILPPREVHSAKGKVFLAAHRGMRIKNGAIMPAVWERVTAVHPDAVLDRKSRPADEYKKALSTCYAVIVPSLSEVSPNAVLEAITFGKPFVATRDTGVVEELSGLGRFVDTRDPQAIADAVIELLDPPVYKEAVERIRAFPVERSWKDVAHTLRALLS